ncbi:MAG: hypothetical protein ACC726_13000 [Chloroflexota bacterium]
MNEPAQLALDDLATGLAEELGDVRTSLEGEMTGYSRGDATFARASSNALEVRLPQDIAEAALRTTDSSVVPGEPGWVRFAPSASDPHAVDRSQAWFRTAWRHAAGD